MLSYWEQKHFTHYDYTIIGSGIVGLQTAIRIKERRPSSKVQILERGIFPTGASTKNAGFACFGSLSELIEDSQSMEMDDVLDLYQRRKQGIELLRNKIGDKAIDFRQEGSHELLTKAELPILNRLSELNHHLQTINGHQNTFIENKCIIHQYGFATEYFETAIQIADEGSIDTGLLLKSLLDYATQLQINIFTGVKVDKWDNGPNGIKLYCLNPIDSNSVEYFQTRKLILCTNAFTNEFITESEMQPGRGQVLITKPLTNLKPKGIFHMDKGYLYARIVDNRLLLGGGRNWDFAAETTTELSLNEKIQAGLIHYLKEYLLPSEKIEIDRQWSGIMAFGNNKLPIIRKIENNIYGAYRMGGMGVALGTKVAIELCEQIFLEE